MRLLLADDDRQLFNMVSSIFHAQWSGVELLYAGTGEAALDIVKREQLDLVLLDISMPGRGGYRTLREIRELSRVPVIMLTAANDVSDKVRALGEGADDYVTKPFDIHELMARVGAVLRRVGVAQPMDRASSFTCGDLSVDFENRRVRVRGELVPMTPHEYELLLLLARNAGRTLPYATLLDMVWGPEYRSEVNYLRVYIRRLRRKLEDDPDRPRYILTERGVGYRCGENGGEVRAREY